MQDQDTVPVILLGLMVSLLSSVFLLRCFGFHWVSGMQMMTTVTLEIFKSLFALHCRFSEEWKNTIHVQENKKEQKYLYRNFLLLFHREHIDYRFRLNSRWHSAIILIYCLSRSLPFFIFCLNLEPVRITNVWITDMLYKYCISIIII